MQRFKERDGLGLHKHLKSANGVYDPTAVSYYWSRNEITNLVFTYQVSVVCFLAYVNSTNIY